MEVFISFEKTISLEVSCHECPIDMKFERWMLLQSLCLLFEQFRASSFITVYIAFEANKTSHLLAARVDTLKWTPKKSIISNNHNESVQGKCLVSVGYRLEGIHFNASTESASRFSDFVSYP